MSRIVDTLHLIALVAWIAALAAAGGAAMAVFITLPTLEVRMEHFGLVLGDDTALHGRIAGGMVMRPVFAQTDRVQAVAAVIAVVTLAFQLAVDRRRWPLGRVAVWLRAICVTVAAALVLLHAVTFAPRMDSALRASWEALDAGDRAEWEAARSEFDADHGRADTLFRARLAIVLVAIGAFAAGGVRRGDGGHGVPVANRVTNHAPRGTPDGEPGR